MSFQLYAFVSAQVLKVMQDFNDQWSSNNKEIDHPGLFYWSS